MSTLYIETSAILCWLLGESKEEFIRSVIECHDLVVSSSLSKLETERALKRSEKQGTLTAGEVQKIRGIVSSVTRSWAFMAITDDIIKGAMRTFPVESVRSLDAIHLSTVLELLKVYPDLSVVSLDNRIIENLIPLGLRSAL